MRIKCEYCGSFIDDTDEKCQFCGAVNSHLVRNAAAIPHTIDELIAFAKKHNLPLKQMHYYLGEDYKGPKAIGIYKNEETGNFIVYKNKSDGTRAVRYEGKDEKYAVNEIYQKMRSDMNDQRARNAASPSQRTQPSNNKSGGNLPRVFYIIMIVIIVLFVLFGGKACGSLLGSSSSSGSVPGSAYTQDYGSSYSDDDDSSWWNDSSDDDSSWSSWSSNSWNNDNWDSSNWNWDSSNSWDYDSSDWNSNW